MADVSAPNAASTNTQTPAGASNTQAPNADPGLMLGDVPPPKTGSTGTPNVAPENPYGKEDWRHGLPDDLRGEETLKVFHDTSTLAKSYVHLRKQMGMDKVTLPSKHATEDDIQQFYDSLGRPKLEEYKVEMAKESKIAPELVEKLKPIAHKAGIMPSQLKAVLEFYEQEQVAGEKQSSEMTLAEINQAKDSLQQEWGKAFSQRSEWAKRYVRENGSPELLKFFQKNPKLSWNPELIKLLAKEGEAKYREDSIKTGAGGGNILDPRQALEKYNTVMGDLKHPYNNAEHPNHKKAVEEVNELFSMAYPNSQDAS